MNRILVNTFLAEGRKWTSRVTLPAQPPEEAAPNMDEATALAMREVLAQVPARQRATLVLRFYCDLTVEQTAEVLRCSAGTVKSQTAKGLTRLRHLWTERGGPPAPLATRAARASRED